ncbi:hypothetical protein [Halobacteriovorax sp.]|uniref:hypothetical protein n=1 Tax=Halobacteriovorax sp. TaxID=2020862 RepID=UPI003AF2A98E
MRILIAEDDKYKADAIFSFLESRFEDLSVDFARSFSSALFKVIDSAEGFDLIVLDMSMPSFDVSEKDPSGGNPESYAGEDFLSQMTLMGHKTPVIVVTQYDSFGTDEKQISLSKLTEKLYKDHRDVFRGSIYFNAATNSWKNKLWTLIDEIVF